MEVPLFLAKMCIIGVEPQLELKNEFKNGFFSFSFFLFLFCLGSTRTRKGEVWILLL